MSFHQTFCSVFMFRGQMHMRFFLPSNELLDLLYLVGDVVAAVYTGVPCVIDPAWWGWLPNGTGSFAFIGFGDGLLMRGGTGGTLLDLDVRGNWRPCCIWEPAGPNYINRRIWNMCYNPKQNLYSISIRLDRWHTSPLILCGHDV